LFESDFVDITLINYSQIETANLKVLLFMVVSGTVLIEHKIFDSEKETTKIAILQLWPVYYISSIQIYLFSIRQILQSKLRVKSNKSSSTFCSKSNNTVSLVTPNLWSNIQIVRTCIISLILYVMIQDL